MSVPKVQIGAMRLRVAGVTREQARRLGERVARGIADLPPHANSGEIPELAVRVRAGDTSSLEQLARAIVEAIGRKAGSR